MKTKIKLLAVLIFGLASTSINAQIEKFQAAYLINFTRLIEWPVEKTERNFIIGVLNNDPIVKELEIIIPNRTVFGKKIEVKVFNNPESITSSHILFIPASQTSKMEALIQKVKDHHTLIVTNASEGVLHGSGINFLIKENKLQFEIKKSNITKYNLKISSTLENLAITKY